MAHIGCNFILQTKRMDWNLSYQDLILGHALRPWTDGTRIGLSLLDMFERLDSVQWNSVGIIAHVNY